MEARGLYLLLEWRWATSRACSDHALRRATLPVGPVVHFYVQRPGFWTPHSRCVPCWACRGREAGLGHTGQHRGLIP